MIELEDRIIYTPIDDPKDVPEWKPEMIWWAANSFHAVYTTKAELSSDYLKFTCTENSETGEIGFLVTEPGLDPDDPGYYLQFLVIFKTPAKKYVPFTRDDIQLYMGRIVSLKDENRTKNASIILWTDTLLVGGLSWSVSFKTLFEKYEFLDGSPCGKLVETLE